MVTDQRSPAPDAAAFASVVELRAVQARLGEQRRQGAEARTFWDAALDFVWRGRATGIVIDNEDERWTVQGLLDYWAAALERAGHPRPESSLVEFDPELAPELADALCPYLGLSAFQEADSRVFFGRDALVDKVVRQLGEHRLVALVGPSGCGKSSLAFAGLASRLHRGALPGSEAWRILAMVPGAEPRATLASLLEPLAQDAGAADPPPPIVLVIDQFEELFTLCKSEPERAAFVAELLALVTAPSPLHRVVLTVRSDFESLVARHPALYERYDAGRVAVTPPSATELRQAIESPAALVGLRFEAGVIDRLLGELLGEPAGLPLLQFTLFRLWQERTRNRVTAASYDRVGGGRQALARAADALYNAMIPQDQMTARRILLLVGLAVDDKHERTRMRVPRSQFFDATDDPGRIERVLDRLLEARLLRQTIGRRGAAPQPEPQIEVAHEALVRNWPRLAEWLQEAQTGVAKWLQQEARGISEGRRLEAKAAEWVGRGRDRRALLDELTLREAERWRDDAAGNGLRASDDLLELIDVSRREVVAGMRRQRAMFAEFAAIAAVVVTTLLVAVWQYRSARSARGEASDSRAQREAETRHLLGMTNLEQGRSLLLDGHPVHPMRALAYLVAARSDEIDSPVLRMLFAQAARGVRSVVFIGHRAGIRKVAFSPGGTRVVTASEDSTARIWDPTTGRPVPPSPLAHLGIVYDVAFSPDGERVVTASADKTAQVWSSATGKPIGRPLAHKAAVYAAAFSPDGERVVTASADNTARVWNARTGEPVTPPLEHPNDVVGAAFSADGTRVATASDRSVRFWDASTGKPVGPTITHPGGLIRIVFSPDGTRVITIGYDVTARIWNTATGAKVAELHHGDAVNAAAFSPDGATVITASDDKAAWVWSASTGEMKIPPLLHQGPVRAVGFSPDGKRVVTASDDRTAQIWDASNGNALGPPLEHQGAVLAAAFSPDGSAVVTASADKTAQLWDASPPDPGTVLRHDGHVLSAAFSADGKRVVTVGLQPAGRPVSAAKQLALPELTSQVWDAAGQLSSPPLVHSGRIIAAVPSADAARVITATDLDAVQVWSTSTGQPLIELPHSSTVTAVAFSPDAARVVTASEDDVAWIWDMATARMLAALPNTGGINSVEFSPDGSRVVTASQDAAARIWIVATGTLVTTLHHTGAVVAAAFSPDGSRVVTASVDNTAMIWDASTGMPLLRHALEHTARVVAAAFSADGTRVVTASEDRTAQVWDAATGTPVAPPLEHAGAVNTAAFSPDGTTVVTASEDGTAQLWDVTTGKPVMPPFEHGAAVRTAAFSPDGTRVVTASADATARIWKLPGDTTSVERWVKLAACTPYRLADGVLMNNPSPPSTCPKH